MHLTPRYLFLLLFTSLGVAPLTAQVLLRTSVDRNSILIGEPVRLNVEARYPLGQSMRWVQTDSIPHMEILMKDSVKVTETVDGKQMTQEWTITSYDTGYWVLPAFRVWVNGKEVYSDTLGIQVHYEQADTNADYRDIKPLEEIPKQLPVKELVMGAAALLLLSLLAFLWWRKRKQPVTTQVPADIPAIEWAQKALLQLQHEEGRMEVKEFYSRLTDIFRVFVAKEKGWTTSEKTSSELIGRLRSLSLPDDTFAGISEALRSADMVKFAKYIPEKSAAMESLQKVEAAIRTIHSLKMKEGAV